MRNGFYKRRVLEFEHTRIISYLIAAQNRDPKKAFPRMQNWWPLSIDKIGDTMSNSDHKKRIKALRESLRIPKDKNLVYD